jgi:hypothetical protein
VGTGDLGVELRRNPTECVDEPGHLALTFGFRYPVDPAVLKVAGDRNRGQSEHKGGGGEPAAHV